jgi:GDP-4-dehydro-6-deoxy-D-mannose reductase
MTKKTTILVTGVSGFVGQHLARELKQQGFVVFGTGIAPVKEIPEHCDQYFGDCDLTKISDVRKLPLEKIDSVINLAGLAQMGASFKNESLYMNTNVAVQTMIAKRLFELGALETRIIAISSGAVYDNRQDMPLTESSNLAPQSSPYSRSKIAMELELDNYRKMGLDIIIARPFNHIGPGQTQGFIVPDLTEKIMTATNDTLTVGNLKTSRDYTDVRDVVKAYILLATLPHLKHDIYNVCSGKSTSGQIILDMLKGALNREDLKTRVDKQYFRPNDAVDHFGDNTRLRTDTRWQPKIPLEQTIQDFVDWYLKQ